MKGWGLSFVAAHYLNISKMHKCYSNINADLRPDPE